MPVTLMIYSQEKESLNLWLKNENSYKYIYTENTRFKSLTSTNCYQNKYLKEPKIKTLKSGGQKGRGE